MRDEEGLKDKSSNSNSLFQITLTGSDRQDGGQDHTHKHNHVTATTNEQTKYRH